MNFKNPNDSIESNDRENFLLFLIYENPGIRFNQLIRISGLKNGVLHHYLSKLEKDGKISINRTNRVCRIFSKGILPEYEILLKWASQTTCQLIMASLFDGQRFTFTELSDRISKSRSTISFYLSKLVADGIVNYSLKDRKKLYRLNTQLYQEITETLTLAL